jgi:glycosyltransferase involved in cell wall biosynthesis
LIQRILHNELAGKTYDHVLISMGAIEHDARMLNIAYTLQQKYSRILLIGLYTPGWQVSCADLDADVLLMENYRYSPMYRLWLGFYRWLHSLGHLLKADSFWAMDLYVLPFITWVSQKNNSRSFYDSREVYTALGEASDHPGKQKIISWLEKRYVRKVDKIFTSGALDSEHLSKIYNIPLPDVIMNLPRFQSPEKSNLLRETFRIPEDKKILVYQGVIHPGRGLMQAVRALAGLPDLVVCVLGTGQAFKEQLSGIAAGLGVSDRLFFQKPVPYRELLRWTTSADLGLCFIEPLSLSLRYALPNKLFEYAMAGIPSIVSDLPQMRPYIDKYRCGVLLPVDAGIDSFVTHLKEMMNPEIYYQMRQNALRLAKDINWEKQQDVVFRIAGSEQK